MSSPIVGQARIVIEGDVGVFAAQTEAKVKKSMASVSKTVDATSKEMAAGMAKSGEAAGEGFTTGADGKLRNSKGQFVKTAAGAGDEAAKEVEKAGTKAGNGFVKSLNSVLGTNFGAKAFGTAAIIGFGVAAAKMAGDYQSSMTRLVTAAGETQANLGSVSSGILQVARDTGTGTKELSAGAYMVESAGFHGADALNILKAAAQGAKVDMADVGVVGDALTTAMTDLHAPTSQAATVMSQLVSTVGHGKMTMDDLASSLHSVLPNAAAVGLNMAQVGGAIATMTAQGISAQQSTQNLNHAILSLVNPTAQQTKEMANLGLNSSTVAKNLGKVGLQGTLEELSDSVIKHMGPAGLTISNAMNTSAIAADKANRMYMALPSSADEIADGFKNGSLSAAQASFEFGGLTGAAGVLGKQWLTSQKASEGFNSMLKSASPDALTYSAAMSKVTGGQTGLQVALHLTGENMKTYKANIATIGAAHAEAGNSVENWGAKQKTFNQQMSELKEDVATTTITIGLALLPMLQKIVGYIQTDVIPAIASTVSWIKENKAWIEPLAIAIGGLVLAYEAYKLVMAAARTLTIAYKVATGEMMITEKAAAIASGEGAASTFLNTSAKVIGTVATWAYQAAVKAAEGAQWLFNAAIDANPLTLMAIALVALVAGVIYAYYHFQTFRTIINDIGTAFKVAFIDTIHAVETAVSAVVSFVGAHWKLMVAIILGPLGLIALGIYTYWNQIKVFFTTVISAVVNFVKDHWKLMVAIVLGPLALIALGVYTYWNQITGVITGALGGIESAWTASSKWLLTQWGKFAGLALAAWQKIVAPISEVWDGVGAALSSVWSGIESVFADGVNSIIDILDSFIDLVNTVLDHLPGGFSLHRINHVTWGSSTVAPGAGFAFNGGGIVPGPATGRDTVGIMATPGEGILTVAATNAIGPGTVHALNNFYGGASSNGGTHFIGGGVVGGLFGKIAGGVKAGVKDVRNIAGDVVIAGMRAGEIPLRAAMGDLPPFISGLGLSALGGMNSGVESLITGKKVAYDNGGWLQPGTTHVENNTGQPEAVFTHDQFERLLEAVKAGHVIVMPDGRVLAQVVNDQNRANKRLT